MPELWGLESHAPHGASLMFAQSDADRLVQAATAALFNGEFSRASELLGEAIQIEPRHIMALTKQAQMAMRGKDHSRALGLTDAALAIEPNCAPAWYQRSAACWSAGRQAEAVQAAGQAVNIQPPNPEFRLRLAQFAAWSGDGATARTALVPLLAAKQDDPVHHAAAVSMLGELAITEGRFGEANRYFDQALEQQPDLTVTRMQRGMNLLRLGDYAAGWEDYAARESVPDLCPDGQPRLADQPWQGQDLFGKTLVVTDDQGHGDAIQFFRTLPMLHALGAAHVTWRTFPPLLRLFSDAAPYASVVNTLPDGARFDFHCNSTSLPRWLGITLDTIPACVPYLRPPSRLKAGVRLPTGRRLKVGLVWSGDARHTRDHLRSIPADLFLRLADLPGISFHSLQHEIRPADMAAVAEHPAISREIEKAADLADTAALIARLDLVITVDTAIAHLAGALGKPVWILLHVAPDWRWLTFRGDSPWYPTARLFRVMPPEWLDKPDQGGWAPMLGRVETALQAFAAG